MEVRGNAGVEEDHSDNWLSNLLAAAGGTQAGEAPMRCLPDICRLT